MTYSPFIIENRIMLIRARMIVNTVTGFVANFQIGNLGTVETYADHADQPLQGPPVCG